MNTKSEAWSLLVLVLSSLLVRIVTSREPPLQEGSVPHTDGTYGSGEEVLEEGEVALFTCSIASHGPMKVTWSHNGTAVAPDGVFVTTATNHKATLNGARMEILTESVLTVAMISANSSGWYTCTFQDAQTNLSESSFLHVIPVRPPDGVHCYRQQQCSGKNTMCNVNNHRCECLPGYARRTEFDADCFGALGLGVSCTLAGDCHMVNSVCGRDGLCRCASGWAQEDQKCVERGFPLHEWLMWVGIGAGIIALIVGGLKVTLFCLQRRTRTHRSLLSVSVDPEGEVEE